MAATDSRPDQRRGNQDLVGGVASQTNFGIEFRVKPADSQTVKAAAAKAGKSDAELLDLATGSLLKAVKQKMLKKQGRVDYAKLRKAGYSDRFLAKLEKA